MKKIAYLFLFSTLFINPLFAKTIILQCKGEFSSKEVVINTSAEFVSLDGWIIKDKFIYNKYSGTIEAWGVIKEYGDDADFRHIKYIEKTKTFAWSDSFYRPRGVFGNNPPHKYVSSGNFDIMTCR